MPVYLLHGFRWPREGFTGIRVHGVVNNLDDFSNNYIQNEGSTQAFLSSFRELYPKIMSQLEDEKTGRTIHFIEPYDPEDLHSENAVCSKFAFVADRVITMAAGSTLPMEDARTPATSSSTNETTPSTTNQPKVSSLSSDSTSTDAQPVMSPASLSPIPLRNPASLFLNIEEATSSSPAVTPQAWEALAELRDQIAAGEKIGWWIAYNGDPERAFNVDEDEEDYEEDDTEDTRDDAGTRTPTQAKVFSEFDFLNQPTPSMLPPELKDVKLEDEVQQAPTSQISQHSQPPPPSDNPVTSDESKLTSRSKRSKSFSLPLRKKSSKPNLPAPKDEHIPEPPVLKEINKKEGFRHKFFGKRGEKE